MPTVKSLLIVTSSGKPTLNSVALCLLTVISFVVPEIVTSSVVESLPVNLIAVPVEAVDKSY